MILETISFTTITGVKDVEVIHNLDEYQLSISEMAEIFAKKNKGLKTGVNAFCQYVTTTGTVSSINLVCIPQSISINGQLAAIYSADTEADIQQRYKPEYEVESI